MRRLQPSQPRFKITKLCFGILDRAHSFPNVGKECALSPLDLLSVSKSRAVLTAHPNPSRTREGLVLSEQSMFLRSNCVKLQQSYKNYNYFKASSKSVFSAYAYVSLLNATEAELEYT